MDNGSTPSGGGGSRWRSLLLLGGGIAAAYAVLHFGGAAWMTRPVQGTPCIAQPRPEGVSFTSRFNSVNQWSNGIRVRPASGQPVPYCAQILSAFRCNTQGPALIEVAYGRNITWFEVPAARTARIYGTAGRATCVIEPLADGF